MQNSFFVSFSHKANAPAKRRQELLIILKVFVSSILPKKEEIVLELFLGYSASVAGYCIGVWWSAHNFHLEVEMLSFSVRKTFGESVQIMSDVVIYTRSPI